MVIDFSPVAISLGPLAIKWYGLAYVMGFFAGYYYFIHAISLRSQTIEGEELPKSFADDLFLGVILAIVIGGRLGYVLFYDPFYFIAVVYQHIKEPA